MPDSPHLLAQTTVQKVYTRFQQAVQSVAEDLDPDEIDEDVLVGALHKYADSALANIARETANAVMRSGRADGLLDATQGEDVVWRRSSVLDQNTCGPCEDADGTEIDGPDDDLSDICDGGSLCRCIPYADMSEQEE
jgi:hypothetical protein